MTKRHRLNFNPKQERQMRHIQKTYQKRGVPSKRAKSLGIATVRKQAKKK